MADNTERYGFRWYKSANGGHSMMPEPEVWPVASSQAFNVNGGAQGVSLRAGDPVINLDSGGVTLCDGAEGAGGALTPYGVCVGIKQYWDVSTERLRTGDKLPSAVVYGTNLERQSLVYVIPFNWGIWEIDCDDNVSYTTQATYDATRGGNANYRLSGVVSVDTYAKPRLDISTVNTTNTLVLRLMGLSPTFENRDLTGNYVKMLVTANLSQHPYQTATGI